MKQDWKTFHSPKLRKHNLHVVHPCTNIRVILCHLPCSYAKPSWQTQTYFSPPLLLPVWSVENIRAKLWSSCISSLFVLKPRNCTTIFLRERQEIKQFNWEFEQRRQIVIFSDTNVSHFRSLGSLPQRRGTKWMMPRSIVVNQPQVRFNNDSLLLATGVFSIPCIFISQSASWQISSNK